MRYLLSVSLLALGLVACGQGDTAADTAADKTDRNRRLLKMRQNARALTIPIKAFISGIYMSIPKTVLMPIFSMYVLRLMMFTVLPEAKPCAIPQDLTLQSEATR